MLKIPVQDAMKRDYENLLLSAIDNKTRIHIYSFIRPSITAGRFAKVSNEELLCWNKYEHDFAFRPTGGGILRHQDDICFGIAFHSNEVGTKNAYKKISDAVRKSLELQNIFCTSAADQQTNNYQLNNFPLKTPKRCFEAALGSELLLDNKKILGLAARRLKNTILIQGALVITSNPDIDKIVIGLASDIDLSKYNFISEKFVNHLHLEFQKNCSM